MPFPWLYRVHYLAYPKKSGVWYSLCKFLVRRVTPRAIDTPSSIKAFGSKREEIEEGVGRNKRTSELFGGDELAAQFRQHREPAVNSSHTRGARFLVVGSEL